MARDAGLPLVCTACTFAFISERLWLRMCRAGEKVSHARFKKVSPESTCVFAPYSTLQQHLEEVHTSIIKSWFVSPGGWGRVRRQPGAFGYMGPRPLAQGPQGPGPSAWICARFRLVYIYTWVYPIGSVFQKLCFLVSPTGGGNRGGGGGEN